MIVALRLTDERLEHRVELRVSRPGGRRGQLWEFSPVLAAAGDPFEGWVFRGSGYGFAAARRVARELGLTNEVQV